jgi:putative PIN family toxin of toxin-antitoxin system
MIKAVFDCVVYVQALLSDRGPAFACLSLAEQKRIALLFSPEILDEVKQSICSPSLRKRIKKITDEVVDKFLQRVGTAGTLNPNPPKLFSLQRDPKDEPYINLAIVTASFLVTRDKDLLDLMQDDDFRKAYPGLTIIDPVPFLAHVRAENVKQHGEE